MDKYKPECKRKPCLDNGSCLEDCPCKNNPQLFRDGTKVVVVNNCKVYVVVSYRDMYDQYVLNYSDGDKSGGYCNIPTWALRAVK